jgi:hypothetical protein
MKWQRTCMIEWLLTPTPGWTIAVRKIEDGGHAIYFWRHLPDHERKLDGGGVSTAGLRAAQKLARATYTQQLARHVSP